MEVRAEPRETDYQITENGTETALDRKISISRAWILFALFVWFEWATFHQFALREVVWAYPTYSDQVYYLGNSYETYDVMLKKGLVPGIRYGLSIPSPQGRLLPVEAAVMYLVFGPTRMTGLALNFAHFVLLQLTVFHFARKLSKRWTVALIALALTGAVATQYSPAGGMMDFRLDFANFCLYGIFISAVLCSDLFFSRAWSLTAGCTAAVLLGTRFLMGPAMLVLWSGTLCVLLFLRWKRSRDDRSPGDLQRRVSNLIAGGSIFVLLVLPIVWLSREAVRRYYIGEVARGATAVRNREAGIRDTFDWLIYYPKTLYTVHLGFNWVVLAVVVLSVLTWAVVRRPNLSGWTIQYSYSIGFAASGLVIPLVVLTMYPTRNPVVSNVLAAPVILLTVIAVAQLVHQVRSDRLGRSVVAGIAVVAVVWSTASILGMSAKPSILTIIRHDASEHMRIIDEILSRAVTLEGGAPRIAVDRITDYVPSLRVLAYERRGIVLNPQFTLGYDIFPPPESEAIAAVQNADFAVLHQSTTSPGGFEYPFDAGMRNIEPKLVAAAGESLDPVLRVTTSRGEIVLYVHPSLRLTGASGDWITSAGADLQGSADSLRRRPHIELRGKTILQEYLAPEVHVTAELRDVTSGAVGQAIPARITIPLTPKKDVPYEINVDVNPAFLPYSGDVQIHLSFDKYVVPKVVGFNPDPRELVIMVPRSIRMAKSEPQPADAKAPHSAAR